MDHVEQNLDILARRQPELARILSVTPLSRIEFVLARKNLPTCFYHRTGADPVPLHSRYDPLQEARQSIAEIDLQGADYFIFLGFGLGYGLDALLERVAAADAHVFVVESDLEILRAACQARDLTHLLSLPHIHLAWPPAGDELGQQWTKFLDPIQARQSVFITHAPSLVLHPSLFKSAAETIRSRTLRTFTDINTLVGQSQAFLENFADNFAHAVSSPGVNAFADQFPGVPAVLVAAGPSLDRNIHELRDMRDCALLLAADTALKPLLAAGIEPHFVLSGDPGYVNYLHVKEAVTRDSLLVADATAHPGTFAAFERRTVVCTFANSSLGPLSDLIASKGVLRAWGSVATMCLDFALLMGCGPIIFVGQDLAFSEGRTYCTGLYSEKEWFAGVHTPEECERRWADLRAAHKIVMTEDLFRSPVASTDKLLSYWNWISAEIEKHPTVHFINATEGGILKDKLDVMSLRETRHRFCHQQLPLHTRVWNLFRRASREVLPADWAILYRLRNECSQLQDIVQMGLSFCRAEVHNGSVEDLTRRLDMVRQTVSRMKTLSPLIDCCNQMGNVGFLRRQTDLASQSGAGRSAAAVRDMYLDYFQSLVRAREIVAMALSRLPHS